MRLQRTMRLTFDVCAMTRRNTLPHPHTRLEKICVRIIKLTFYFYVSFASCVIIVDETQVSRLAIEFYRRRTISLWLSLPDRSKCAKGNEYVFLIWFFSFLLVYLLVIFRIPDQIKIVSIFSFAESKAAGSQPLNSLLKPMAVLWASHNRKCT